MLKTGGTTNGWTAGNDDVLSPAPAGGQWYYLAFTYNGIVIRNFWNGVPLNAGHNVNGNIIGDPYTICIGAYAGNNDAGPISLGLDALIDEVRVEHVFRSPNWIRATYMTVASNASFTVFGSVQGPAGSNIPPTSWLTNYYPTVSSSNYPTLAASVASNGMTVWGCYLAGLSPTNTIALRAGIAISNGSILVTYPTGLAVYSNMSRYYEVDSLTNLLGGTWQPVPGATNVLGDNAPVTYTNSSPNGRIYYRVKARLQ